MILFINEDSSRTESIQHILAPLGQEVLQAEDINHIPLDEGSPSIDLVLISIDAQNIDPLFVIEKIRNREMFSRTPILVVTALSSPLYFIDTFEKGASDYFVLGVDDTALLGKALKLLDKRDH